MSRSWPREMTLLVLVLVTLYLNVLTLSKLADLGGVSPSTITTVTGIVSSLSLFVFYVVFSLVVELGDKIVEAVIGSRDSGSGLWKSVGGVLAFAGLMAAIAYGVLSNYVSSLGLTYVVVVGAAFVSLMTLEIAAPVFKPFLPDISASNEGESAW